MELPEGDELAKIKRLAVDTKAGVCMYEPAVGAAPVRVISTNDSVFVAASKVKEPVMVCTLPLSVAEVPGANTYETGDARPGAVVRHNPVMMLANPNAK